jgi:hypothetical protein
MFAARRKAPGFIELPEAKAHLLDEQDDPSDDFTDSKLTKPQVALPAERKYQPLQAFEIDSTPVNIQEGWEEIEEEDEELKASIQALKRKKSEQQRILTLPDVRAKRKEQVLKEDCSTEFGVELITSEDIKEAEKYEDIAVEQMANEHYNQVKQIDHPSFLNDKKRQDELENKLVIENNFIEVDGFVDLGELAELCKLENLVANQFSEEEIKEAEKAFREKFPGMKPLFKDYPEDWTFFDTKGDPTNRQYFKLPFLGFYFDSEHFKSTGKKIIVGVLALAGAIPFAYFTFNGAIFLGKGTAIFCTAGSLATNTYLNYGTIPKAGEAALERIRTFKKYPIRNTLCFVGAFIGGGVALRLGYESGVIFDEIFGTGTVLRTINAVVNGAVFSITRFYGMGNLAKRAEDNLLQLSTREKFKTLCDPNVIFAAVTAAVVTLPFGLKFNKVFTGSTKPDGAEWLLTVVGGLPSTLLYFGQNVLLFPTVKKLWNDTLRVSASQSSCGGKFRVWLGRGFTTSLVVSSGFSLWSLTDALLPGKSPLAIAVKVVACIAADGVNYKLVAETVYLDPKPRMKRAKTEPLLHQVEHKRSEFYRLVPNENKSSPGPIATKDFYLPLVSPSFDQVKTRKKGVTFSFAKEVKDDVQDSKRNQQKPPIAMPVKIPAAAAAKTALVKSTSAKPALAKKDIPVEVQYGFTLLSGLREAYKTKKIEGIQADPALKQKLQALEKIANTYPEYFKKKR